MTMSEEKSSARIRGTRRSRITDSNLHLSAFVLLRGTNDGILLLRAGTGHPLSFRRGKLVLPSSMLNFGEDPKDGAKRVLRDQVEHSEGFQPRFLEIQSYLGSHWDICFIYECDSLDSKLDPRQPYIESAFYSLSSLPRIEIAADHLEVIDGLRNNK